MSYHAHAKSLISTDCSEPSIRLVSKDKSDAVQRLQKGFSKVHLIPKLFTHYKQQ